MANAYINVYKSNPTAGGVDGTQVSTDDAESSPISVTLDASKAESAVITCALRCEDGYKTIGDTTLSLVGTDTSKWSLSATADGTFASTLTISDVIENKNKLFYVKAISSSTETPVNDTSTNIKVVTKIQAA
ncbi:hypothetical protein FYJ78_03315 [Selenomonas sp. WCA-380-WT-3B 3/]|uniref:Uncharacterized protein n=1 Tax=Selenomonas montiformis TaxID=2652285 RepID=A0A6I2UVW4_9FIRM|nr:hypothetical protein [Selenomonas montiformis]MSV24230.1 hypothetical protein [Selenomonas montiformis]